MVGAFGVTTIMSPWGFVKASVPIVPLKSLSFYNIHTGESLIDCPYWIDGDYQTESLMQIQYLFRDHRNEQQHCIDVNLLDLLFSLHQLLESRNPFHLISGYRSEATNAMLCEVSTGVASNSQHLYGKAADIALEDRTPSQIQKAARSLGGGGVGRYPFFVHIDTDRVRYWGET